MAIAAAIAATGVGVLHAQIPGPNVNLVSGTTLPDGDPFLQRQNEPAAAVSTRNPLHLLAGSNDYRTVDYPGIPDDNEANKDAWLSYYWSVDGGQTWKSTLLPGFPQDTTPFGKASPMHGFDAGADPIVRAGTNGLFYYTGMAFNRGTNGLGIIAVTRFIDNNNTPSNPIALIDTKALDSGTAGQFADKPYAAVDIPRAGAKICTIQAPGAPAPQKFPGGNVYVAYIIAVGNDKNPVTRMMLTRSTDCGATWSKPIKVSERLHVSQGANMAIDPNTGTLYLAWREIADSNAPDGIVLVKSTDGGQTFTKPAVIATIKPFDQGGGLYSFRTRAYPTMATDGAGRVYVAWSERGWGPASPPPPGLTVPPGDARIVMTTSRDGVNWTPRQAIDNDPSVRGHQIMPSITAIAGKVTAIWYDFRDDVSKVFQPYIDDSQVKAPGAPGKRHTVDVRVAQADVADAPSFHGSAKLSQYITGFRPGHTQKEQLQFNPPNLPLYGQGKVAFIGDYIDVAGLMFVQDANRNWKFNTSPDGPAVAYGFWGDNRDVRPPRDGDWTHYTPVNMVNTLTGIQLAACQPGQTGMRNANIYSARISPGLVVGAPVNSKRLGATPRTFVVFAQNNTDAPREGRRYRLAILNQPAGGKASFLQVPQAGLPDPLTTLEVTAAPRSTASRVVYVTSSDPTAKVNVSVVEIQNPKTTAPPLNVQGTIVLNPDVTSPDVTSPDVTSSEVFNPDVTSADVTNPDVTSLSATNPDVTSTNIASPDVTSVDVGNVSLVNPDVTSPDVTSPDVTSAAVTNLDFANPDVTSNTVKNPSLSDVTWTVSNTGKGVGSFSVKTFLAKNTPKGFLKQLILHKTYKTPVTTNTGQDDCTLKTQTQNVLVANIVNPDVTSTGVGAPDVTSADVTNATIALAPGESAKITLRVVNPDIEEFPVVTKQVTESNGQTRTVTISTDFDTAQEAAPVVTSQAISAGDTAPASSAPPIVTTESLPDGVVTIPYTATSSGPVRLTSIGGEGTARTWTIAASSTDGIVRPLPPGLSLDPATGIISGVPAAAGSFPFTVRVSDSATPTPQSNTKDLFIRIAPFANTQSVTTLEDHAAVLTLTAAGADNSALAFARTPPSNGTLSGSGANVTYTPGDNFNGSDAFTFTASLSTPFGLLVSPPATVSIAVTAVNDPPSFSVGADQSAFDASAHSVPGWATAISPGPPDEAGQTVTFVVTQNDHPELFAAGPVISGNGTLSYTPAAGAAGTAHITIVLRDNGGTANGGSDTSAPATFSIVMALNRPPVATADQYTTREDTPLVSSATCAPVAYPGFANVSSLQLNGNAQQALTADGSVLRLVPAADFQAGSAFRTTPVGISKFSTSFQFRMTGNGSDGGGPFGYDGQGQGADGIVFVLQNAGLTALGGSGGQLGYSNDYSGAPGITPSVGVEFDTFDNPELGDADSNHVGIDINGTVFSVVAQGMPGRFDDGNLWTAWVEYDGTVLRVWVSADGIRPAVPTLTYTVDLPAILGSTTAFAGFTSATGLDFENADIVSWTFADCTVGVLSNDSDPDGDPLTAMLVDAPTHASAFSLNSDGSFTYTPAGDYSGPDAFTYKANDGHVDSNTVMVAITVEPVNDAPSFTKGASQTVADTAGAQTVAGWATLISAGPPDESGQTLTFHAAPADPSLFLVPPAIAPDGTLTFTPANPASGSTVVSVTLQDSGGTADGGVDTSAAQTFTITVTGTPPAQPANLVTRSPLAGRVDLTWSDNSSNETRFEIANTDALAVLQSAGANVTAASFTGLNPGTSYHWYVRACNADGCSAWFGPVGQTPDGSDPFITATDDSATVTAGVASIITVLTNDSDPDGDVLSITGVTAPAHGSASPNADGTITYTPANDFSGPDSFTYTVSDGHGDTATATVHVMVLSPVCSAAPPGLVSWWPAEDNANDIQGGNNGTLVKGATFGPGEVGQAFVFNGGGTYVGAPASPTLDIRNALTLAAWINPSQYPASAAVIAGRPSSYQLNVLPNHHIRFAYPVGGSVSQWADSASEIPLNQWTHVAATFDGAMVNVYVNGALDGNGARAGPIDSMTKPFQIGGFDDPGNFVGGFFIGRIDEVELYSAALSATDIAHLFNAASAGTCNCAPLPNGAVAWWPGNGTFNDIVGGHTGQPYGGTGFARGEVGQAVSFLVEDLSYDHVRVDPAPDLVMSNAMTMAAWIYSVRDWPYPQVVISKEGEYQFGRFPDGTIRWAFGNDPGFNWVNTGYVVPLNTWTHVAVTFDNGAVKTYANGALVHTFAGSGAIGDANASMNDLFIGGRQAVDLNWFKGNLDEVQIFNRALTPAEVSAIVNAGSLGICAPAPVATDDASTTNEDVPATIAVLSNDTDPAGLGLHVTSWTAPAHGSVTHNADDTFTYAPAPNFNGADGFSYDVADARGGTATANVTITVNAVNDPPSFAKGADQTALDTAGPQTVVGWATLISPGPPDESGQTVVFRATAADPSLFSAQPAISSDGTLTFTPADPARGTTIVTVTAQDNGGTANGGVNTSAPQMFSIAITHHAPAATDDNATVAENRLVGIDVLANDATTPPGGALSVLSATQAGNGIALLCLPLMASEATALWTGDGQSRDAWGAHDGVSNAGVTFVPGKVGSAFALDGTSGYVTVPNDASLSPTTAMSLGAWIYPTAARPSAAIVKKAGAGAGGYALEMDASGSAVNFLVSVQGNWIASGAAPVPLNQWTHVMGTYDGASVRVYINGIQARITATSGTISASSSDLWIGNDPSQASRFFSGLIDEVFLASVALGTGDVSLMAAVGVAGACRPTATGAVAGDASGLYAGPIVTTVTTSTGTSTKNDGAAILLQRVDATHIIGLPIPRDPTTAITGVLTNTSAGVLTYDMTVVITEPGACLSPATLTGTFTVDTVNNTFAGTLQGQNTDCAAETDAINLVRQTGSTGVIYAPDRGFNGADAFTYTIVDGLGSAATANVAVTVTPVNQPPSFTPGPNLPQILEDAGPQTFVGWATNIKPGPPNESGQHLTFVVSNNTNPALFSTPPAIDATTGTLTFQTAPNANGFAQFSVQLHDDGGTANGGVDRSPPSPLLVSVAQVNDPPSFTKGPDVIVSEDSGPQSFVGWATNISAGPANESGQTVFFTVVANSNPSLFSFGPQISGTNPGPAGRLTFTPASNAFGSATITVRAQDSGGTANGGNNLSPTQTFVITVTGVNDPPVVTVPQAPMSFSLFTVSLLPSGAVGERRPLSIAVADVDNDGKLDIVTANQASHDISVLLGNGDGTFQPARSSPTGLASQWVAAGEFNGDGKIDLAVSDGNQTQVLLGNGDGTFTAFGPYVLGGMQVVAVDVNHDGKLDLVSTLNFGQLVVQLGNGNGTFQPTITYPIASDAIGVAVADLNGDGKPDIVTASRTPNTLSVFLGVGDGTFISAPAVTLQSGPSSLSAADLNGDGKQDLIVGNQFSGNVAVLLGNGDGTFQSASTLTAGSDPLLLAAADLNRDGRIDLIVSDVNSHDAYVFAGNGNGTFAAPAVFALAASSVPRGVAVGDFNGDGLIDFVVPNQTTDDVAVLTNTLQAYVENGPPVVITSDGTLTDIDSADLDTGTLTVDLQLSATADDRLAIRNQGAGIGQVGVSGNVVTFSGVPIGAWAGGAGVGNPLVVTFNASATPAIAQAVLRNVTFENVSDNPVSATRFLRFVATDGDGGTSNPAFKSLAVVALDDPPVAADQSTTTAFETPINIALTATDPDSVGLFYSIVQPPAHGTLSGAPPSVTYTPLAAYFGGDSFTFKATDGILGSNIATVSITVTRPNRPPTANPDSYSIPANMTLSVSAPGVLGNDGDPDGDALTAVLVTGVSHGTLSLNAAGTFSYTPAAGFVGLDSFSYAASDGTLQSAPATVTVDVTSVTPTAANDSYRTLQNSGVPANAAAFWPFNEGGGTRVYDASSNGNTGEFVHTPLWTSADVPTPSAPNALVFGGGDAISVADMPSQHMGVADGSGLTLAAWVKQTVANLATAGIISKPQTPGGTGWALRIEAGQADFGFNNGQANCSYRTPAAALPVGQWVHIAATFKYDAVVGRGAVKLYVNGQVVDDEPADENACAIGPLLTSSEPLQIGREFESDTDGRYFRGLIALPQIFAEPLDDARVGALQQNVPLVVAAPGVLGNDVNPNSTGAPYAGLTASVSRQPLHGDVRLLADGSFAYTPFAEFFGVDSFEYVASNGGSASAPATVSITVDRLNERPVARDDQYSIAEDQTLSTTVPSMPGFLLYNDVDPEGAALSAILVAAPSHGTLTFNAGGIQGAFVYQPDPGFHGDDSFSYRVSDGELWSNVAAASIVVSATPATPLFNTTGPGTAKISYFNPEPIPAQAHTSATSGLAVSFFNPASVQSPPSPPPATFSPTFAVSFFNPAPVPSPPSPPPPTFSPTFAVSFFNPAQPPVLITPPTPQAAAAPAISYLSGPPPSSGGGGSAVPQPSAAIGGATFAAGPTVTSVSPATLSIAAGSQALVLSGANLLGASAVNFSDATGIRVNAIDVSADGRTLTASIALAPSTPQATITISVTTASGTSPVTAATVVTIVP